MGRKRNENNPLMYIEQPSIKKPKGNNQQHYMSSRKRRSKHSETDNEKNLSQTGKSRRRPIKTIRSYGQTSANDELQHEQDEHKRIPQQQRVMFKDMSLKEQLKYLSRSSTYIPKLRCEIKTNENTFRGVITDFTDNDTVIYMRIGRSSKKQKILLKDIKHVRLLGLKSTLDS